MACKCIDHCLCTTLSLIRHRIDDRIQVGTMTATGERVKQHSSNFAVALSLAFERIVVGIRGSEHFCGRHPDTFAGEAGLRHAAACARR